MVNYFKEDIKNEQRRIQRLIDLTEPDQPLHVDETTAEHVDESAANYGSLSVERRGNSLYCYELQRRSGAPHRKKYLGTPQSPRVKDLLDSKCRDEKLRRLRENADLLQNLESQYLDYDAAAILAALPRTYQELTSEENFNQRYRELQQWAAADYPRNDAPFPQSETYARDGRRMRSKGECIFYNIFEDMRLPNRYDSVISITDRDGRTKKLSPDFLIQCFDGSFIIIEHLGWYTGLKYGIDFGEKCYWYLQEGFILGKNFFVTSDDAHGGTDSRLILNVARQAERLFYGY